MKKIALCLALLFLLSILAISQESEEAPIETEINFNDPSTWTLDNLDQIDFTQVTPEALLKASPEIVEVVSATQAEDYFFKGKGKLPRSNLNNNELALYQKIYSTVKIETFKDIRGVTFKEGGIVWGDKEISFSKATSLKISKEEVKFETKRGIETRKGIVIGDFFLEKGSIEINGLTKFGDNSKILEYNKEGEKSTFYEVKKETYYSNVKGGCGFKPNCIEKANYIMDVSVSSNNQLVIKALDNSISKFNLAEILDKSKVIFNDKGEIELEFSKKPVKIKGNPSKLTTKIESVFYSKETKDTHILKLNPSDYGLHVYQCTECTYAGTMTERGYVVMKSMKETSAAKINKWVNELTKRYGERKPQEILAYFNDIRELRLIDALYIAGDKTKLDPNFITSVAFFEGLIRWMDTEYYKDPNSVVSAYSDIGADRFGKEYEEWEQEVEGKIEVVGNKLKGKIINVEGQELFVTQQLNFEFEVDKIKTVGSKTIAELRGDIIEIEGNKMKIITQGFKERNYLMPDFNEGDEFEIVGMVTSERGEESPRVDFRNIETATQGLAVMLQRRQDLFLDDVQRAGFDPAKLSNDEINYWTYVYYNAGSGPPEDLFGKGRGIVQNRLKIGGLGRLKVPSGQLGTAGTGNPISNAQQVIATKKLLEKVSPDLPEATKIALAE